MSFLLYASKTQLSVRDREPVTSGSVGVYHVRFEFSEDWDGMDKTASFRFHTQTVSVALDENGECGIPWEIIDHFEPQQKLYAGVYGTKDGVEVLPTVWTALGELLEGTTYGQNSRPPTPNLWEQKLAQKQDKLHGEPGQIAGFDEDGNLEAQEPLGMGVADHEELTGRDKEAQHPISSIEGLAQELLRIPAPVEPLTNEELDKLLNFDGIGTGGVTGGTGTSDHRLLTNRDAESQHPVASIEGLQDELDTIPRPMTSTELRQILLN